MQKKYLSILILLSLAYTKLAQAENEKTCEIIMRSNRAGGNGHNSMKFDYKGQFSAQYKMQVPEDLKNVKSQGFGSQRFLIRLDSWGLSFYAQKNRSKRIYNFNADRMKKLYQGDNIDQDITLSYYDPHISRSANGRSMGATRSEIYSFQIKCP